MRAPVQPTQLKKVLRTLGSQGQGVVARRELNKGAVLMCARGLRLDGCLRKDASGGPSLCRASNTKAYSST